MRDEATVGDIDAALMMTRRPEYSADYQGMLRHLETLLSRRSDTPKYQGVFWPAESWITERALYGPKRHPLLAGVRDDLSDLIALDVPCRLLYDRSRGGRVEDPVLPRHPLSNGRADTIIPMAAMPDLTPGKLRPMDARWVCGYDPLGLVSPFHIFSGLRKRTSCSLVTGGPPHSRR
jgi:hypothetical protein